MGSARWFSLGMSGSWSAKLAMVSIWRLSWTECPICPSSMLAVDVSYWLGAQQGSISGLHVVSSCDLSSTEPSSWVFKVSQEQVSQGIQAEVVRPLMTQSCKSYSVPSTSFFGQKASLRASSDSREGDHTRVWILGGMIHWGPSSETSFQRRHQFLLGFWSDIKFSTIK